MKKKASSWAKIWDTVEELEVGNKVEFSREFLIDIGVESFPNGKYVIELGKGDWLTVERIK